MAAKTGSEKGGKNTKKSSVLLIIIIVLLLIVILAAVLIFTGIVKLPFLSVAQGQTEETALQPRLLYSLQEFQVNLADSGTKRFLRTSIDLAYNEKKLTKELETRQSEIRSLIITVLRSKHVADLGEPGGMKSLEEDLLATLNSALVEGEIMAVYYREFIFQ